MYDNSIYAHRELEPTCIISHILAEFQHVSCKCLSVLLALFVCSKYYIVM